MKHIVCNDIHYCVFPEVESTCSKMSQLTSDNDLYLKIPANFQIHSSMRLGVFYWASRTISFFNKDWSKLHTLQSALATEQFYPKSTKLPCGTELATWSIITDFYWIKPSTRNSNNFLKSVNTLLYVFQ